MSLRPSDEECVSPVARKRHKESLSSPARGKAKVVIGTTTSETRANENFILASFERQSVSTERFLLATSAFCVAFRTR